MVEQEVVFANYGFCPICEQAVRFSATGSYFRNDYHCDNCNSIPRERALMLCLERFFPNFRDLVVHESSPAAQGASPRLRQECSRYIATRPFPGVDRGSTHDGVRCEDLEHLTFADGEIDLHVTQDVVEHVLDPDAVFREIERTLRPGGAHLFTVPLVRKTRRSFVRAERAEDGTIVHHVEPKYHEDDSLVTVDWGYDISDRILRASGMVTRIIDIDDIEHGIRADLNEVLISLKLEK